MYKLVKSLLVAVALTISASAFSQTVAPATTAEEDAVIVLIARLNERDATIAAMREENLQLLLDNFELKTSNAKLKESLRSARRQYQSLLLKTSIQRALDESVKDARELLTRIDARLSKITK